MTRISRPKTVLILQLRGTKLAFSLSRMTDFSFRRWEKAHSVNTHCGVITALPRAEYFIILFVITKGVVRADRVPVLLSIRYHHNIVLVIQERDLFSPSPDMYANPDIRRDIKLLLPAMSNTRIFLIKRFNMKESHIFNWLSEYLSRQLRDSQSNKAQLYPTTNLKWKNRWLSL